MPMREKIVRKQFTKSKRTKIKNLEKFLLNLDLKLSLLGNDDSLPFFKTSCSGTSFSDN